MEEGLSWVSSKRDGKRHFFPTPGSDVGIGAHSKMSPPLRSLLGNSFL